MWGETSILSHQPLPQRPLRAVQSVSDDLHDTHMKGSRVPRCCHSGPGATHLDVVVHHARGVGGSEEKVWTRGPPSVDDELEGIRAHLPPSPHTHLITHEPRLTAHCSALTGNWRWATHRPPSRSKLSFCGRMGGPRGERGVVMAALPPTTHNSHCATRHPGQPLPQSLQCPSLATPHLLPLMLHL